VSDEHLVARVGKKQTGTTGECIDDVSHDETADDADDSSERDGSSRLAERDSTDKDNGFHALTEDGDQRQDYQGPLSGLGTTIDIYRISASTRPRHAVGKRQNTNFGHRKQPGA
jgi:hypothetical protein